MSICARIGKHAFAKSFEGMEYFQRKAGSYKKYLEIAEPKSGVSMFYISLQISEVCGNAIPPPPPPQEKRGSKVNPRNFREIQRQKPFYKIILNLMKWLINFVLTPLNVKHCKLLLNSHGCKCYKFIPSCIKLEF